MRHIDLCQYFNYLAERVIESQKKNTKIKVADFLRKYKRGKCTSSDAMMYIDTIREIIDDKYAEEVDEKIHDMKSDLSLEILISNMEMIDS